MDNNILASDQLWFDVENVKNTTPKRIDAVNRQLWFDVENVKNTTFTEAEARTIKLWFDVENVRNTIIACIIADAGGDLT